jgi:hypothetical protein
VKSTGKAREKIYKHLDYLVTSMLAGKEGIEWAKNPLYIHLGEEFPDEHDVVLRRVTGGAKKQSQVRRARGQSAETF